MDWWKDELLVKPMPGFNFRGLSASITEDQTDHVQVAEVCAVILHSSRALNAIERMHVNHTVCFKSGVLIFL